MFPMMAATVAIEYSFLFSNKNLATKAEMSMTTITIARYTDGAYKRVMSTGRTSKPQKVKKTCKK